MDLKEQVFKAFRSRIEAGENERAAINFSDDDFPEFTVQDICDFCDKGYAKKNTRSFMLYDEAAKEALEK